MQTFVVFCSIFLSLYGNVVEAHYDFIIGKILLYIIISLLQLASIYFVLQLAEGQPAWQ